METTRFKETANKNKSAKWKDNGKTTGNKPDPEQAQNEQQLNMFNTFLFNTFLFNTFFIWLVQVPNP